MKLIKPSFEIIEQKPGMQGIYEQIELAARNCYKSEGLIKYDEEGNSTTAKDFVDKVVNIYKHQSVAEHGTIYLKYICVKSAINILEKYRYNPYSKIQSTYDDLTMTYYVTTNYRVLLENNWLDDLEYLCEPTKYHEKRVTVRFICDRGVMAELTRHRSFSFSVESTRYCNYSLGKFNNKLTFIIPSHFGDYEECSLCMGDASRSGSGSFDVVEFLEFLCKSESTYKYLLHEGWTPQEARAVLPNALKTEVIMTGFVSDWQHFFSLRDNEKAHPDMVALARPLHEEFIKRGYMY